MKYGFMQKAMWAGFEKTFQKHLSATLSESNPKKVMKVAHKKYKDIIAGIDEFEKGDRFLINILSCAMIASVLLSVEKEYDVEQIRAYYRNAMCDNALTKLSSKKSKAYTPEGRDLLKKQAKASELNTNPYSWKFSVEDGETLNQYTAYFHTCGICYLMNKLGLSKYTPALCSLDYDMAALNDTEFEREYTLASGGPYCDCHYNHKA